MELRLLDKTLDANAIDPEVRSETGETIAVPGYLDHTSLSIKNYEHSKINSHFHAQSSAV